MIRMPRIARRPYRETKNGPPRVGVESPELEGNYRFITSIGGKRNRLAP